MQVLSTAGGGGERVASKARQGGGYLDVKDADISGEGRRGEAPRQ